MTLIKASGPAPYMRKILEVGITPKGQWAFAFDPHAREFFEKRHLLGALGEAMAVFGERLKYEDILAAEGEGLPILLGPDGTPLA